MRLEVRTDWQSFCKLPGDLIAMHLDVEFDRSKIVQKMAQRIELGAGQFVNWLQEVGNQNVEVMRRHASKNHCLKNPVEAASDSDTIRQDEVLLTRFLSTQVQKIGKACCRSAMGH